ncbi:hypothetical protein Pmani_000204 [Petrolisthes manimaculis]|uniref:Apple domain-containing protein n=1 Tax=Petrolisthes manimaculis TaxID=1843537 RepID=A0AAE1UMK8_9EUCA|nr:hypothetical protein Pmani_000204 [Petrolisthes manimaculis]
MEVLGLRLLVTATLLVLTGAIIDQRMIIAPGKTFEISLTSEIANLSSSCKCKMRCNALPSCSSWSFVYTNEFNTNTTECRISDQGPEDLNLNVHANSIYGYKLSSLNSDIGVITGPDGLLYIKPPLQYPLQEMRDHCDKIPGFRLLILKTPLQFKFAKEFLATVAHGGLLDLVKTGSNALRWGDGTFMPTQHYSYIRSIGRSSDYLFQFRMIDADEFLIDYVAIEGTRSFICQGSENLLW